MMLLMLSVQDLFIVTNQLLEVTPIPDLLTYKLQTWWIINYYEMQNNWDTFLPIFREIFKKIAYFTYFLSKYTACTHVGVAL